ncbi:hypothetical protein GGQ74_002319 [Desulfobaculum xiamenense]|uniref:Type II secretion system protein N n=1 Tax=Desulfobaculum xiamenense TaxID=995050 RepID=A0A846QIG1_9BACT|nr:hypothetical protein [Desulfobaculum xiamenense]NJB68646.1 hypothetical protein [Desulfobaculum xiamenense]
MAQTILLSQRKKRGGLLRGTGMTLLFAAALTAGLILFTPWPTVWNMALGSALERMPNVRASWKELDEAGAFRFRLAQVQGFTHTARFSADEVRFAIGFTPLTIRGLDIDFGRTKTSMDEARLELGLAPLARLVLVTGPELRADLFRGRTLVVNGGAELSRLFEGRGLSGVLNVSADCRWNTGFEGYPNAGNIELTAESLTLPDGTEARGLNIGADLNGKNVLIRKVAAEEPLRLRARGTAELRKNFFYTRVLLDGDLQTGDQRIPFRREDRLERLLN